MQRLFHFIQFTSHQAHPGGQQLKGGPRLDLFGGQQGQPVQQGGDVSPKEQRQRRLRQQITGIGVIRDRQSVNNRRFIQGILDIPVAGAPVELCGSSGIGALQPLEQKVGKERTGSFSPPPGIGCVSGGEPVY